MEVSLASLWLPILLSAVGVFFASSIIWMAIPIIHKNDYKRLGEKEGAVLEALRSWNLGPGLHMFPSCDPKALKDNPEAQARYKAGPWGVITLMGAPPSMGSCLGMWAVNTVLMGAIVGYIASMALPAGAEGMKVFRIAFIVTLLAYGGSVLTDSIWKGRPWSLAPGALFDAMVYAVITGGIFSWLWPAPEIKLPI